MADKLQRAIARIKADDKTDGRQFLWEILKADPKNDKAWLWMSAVVDTDELRQECLEEALKVNPSNQTARNGLAKLRRMQQ
jgi:Tfp pilus assembly protein PilF